jgi:hypothetical protein
MVAALHYKTFHCDWEPFTPSHGRWSGNSFTGFPQNGQGSGSRPPEASAYASGSWPRCPMRSDSLPELGGVGLDKLAD